MPDTFTNHTPGIPFIEIPDTDSTNNYAMQLVHKGLATDGMVCFAHHQTAGKGQRGRHWLSEPGANIAMSLVLKANCLPVSNPFTLSIISALAVYDFFLQYAQSETSVKWPNDLYWRDRKAGGILIENVIQGQDWQWAIVGIGININQTLFDTGVANAVSLKQITGKQYDPVALAREICTCFYNRFQQFLKDGINGLLQEYNTVLYRKGLPLRLRKNNVVFDCRLKGVNEFGQLVAETSVEEYFNVGDVEWIFSQP